MDVGVITYTIVNSLILTWQFCEFIKSVQFKVYGELHGINSFIFHLQGYAEDGEAPQWWIDHDYEFEYNFIDAATLLHIYSPDLTLAAISRATGINQTQLSHYANGVKTPRPAQRQRIVDGLHAIGRRLMAVR